MKTYAFIALLLLSTSIFAQNDKKTFSEPDTQTVYEISEPEIEITGGLGFVWLIQINMTMTLIKHLYFQPRLSTVIAAGEYGLVLGYQKRYDENSLIRFGIGYSKGVFITFDGSDKNNWKSIYLRTGLLIRKGKSYIVNPNLNLLKSRDSLILSFNSAVGYCSFKQHW
ncbi:MAG: hypothetical protein ACXABG_10985 [Promethearchaeota archaeon]|jgi:hypothetical protein